MGKPKSANQLKATNGRKKKSVKVKLVPKIISLETIQSKKRGNQPLNAEDREFILRKLSPFLNMGLSVNKACLEAEIPKSTVFDLIAEEDDFAEKIAREKNYLAKTTSGMLFNILMDIADRVSRKEKVTEADKQFIWTYVNTSGATKFEFGTRDLGEQEDFEDMVAKTREGLEKESLSDRIKRLTAERAKSVQPPTSKRNRRS